MTSQLSEITTGQNRVGKLFTSNRLEPISSKTSVSPVAQNRRMPSSIAPSRHAFQSHLSNSEDGSGMTGGQGEGNNYQQTYYHSSHDANSGFLQPVHPAYPSNGNPNDGVLFQKVGQGYNAPNVQPLPPYIGPDGRPVTPFILNDDTIIEFEEESQEEYFRQRKQRAVTHCILFAIAILIGVLILFLSRGLTASMTSATITRRMGAAGALGGMSTHG